MTIYKSVALTIYDNENEQTVLISDDPDGLDMVHVKQKDDYYGKLNFTMDVDMAEAVANAILEQVKHIREAQK